MQALRVVEGGTGFAAGGPAGLSFLPRASFFFSDFFHSTDTYFHTLGVKQTWEFWTYIYKGISGHEGLCWKHLSDLKRVRGSSDSI